MESSEMMVMFDVILNDHSSILSSSLYCLQQEGFMCDTRLQGIDGHVLVHGVVLSVTSLLFKETVEKLSSGDTNIKFINFKQINENISMINLFVKLLYTGKIICSKDEVEKILNLTKIFKIKNFCYNVNQEIVAAKVSEDNLNSISKTEFSPIKITQTENIETAEGSDCGFSTHLKKSPSDISDHVTDKEGHNSPDETLAGDRNLSPENGRKVSARKRKLNPKYFDETSKTSTKATIQKIRSRNSFPENSEKGVPSVSRKSKSAIADTSSVKEVKTRTRGRRSNKGCETAEKEKMISSSSLSANAVKNEITNNDHQVKQEQDTKTIMQTRNGQVDKNEVKDEIKAETINKDLNSIKTEQSKSTVQKNNVEKDESESESQDDEKQESKENEQNGDLFAKLGLISTKENTVVAEKNTPLKCETAVPDAKSKKVNHAKNVRKPRNSKLDKPKTCWICKKVLENYEEYSKHKQEMHPFWVKKIQMRNQKLKGRTRNYCTACDIKFDSYQSFLQHRKEVEHKRQNHLTVYSCEYCEYKTKVECSLDLHKIKKHNMDISESNFEVFRCQVEGCDYFALRKSTLDVHVENVHGTDKIEVCEICGKTMSTRKQLQQHVKMHIPVEQREKRFECPECNRKFERGTDFRIHFKHTHRNEKSFMCHLCPYRVTTQRLLDIHLANQHQHPLPSYIKQHTCHVCGYVTIYKHYLQQHLNRHKGVPMYQCHLCEKSFLAKPNLTAHLWRHKTENKTCPYEGCKYQGKGQGYKIHIKLMHTQKDKRPYRCPMCNYMGKSRCRVRNHLLKFHKMRKVKEEIVYIPDQQEVEINEINNLEETEAVQQITHVTANGNIELDTMDLDSKSVDLVMKGLYKQQNNIQIEDSELYVAQESSDQDTGDVVKDEPTSVDNVTHMIVDNDGILTAIQDSKNVIILQHDGLQYGAIEVVNSQI